MWLLFHNNFRGGVSDLCTSVGNKLKVVRIATWATAIGASGLCAVGSYTYDYNRKCEARIAELKQMRADKQP